jgi:hypothetical protein
MQQLQPTLPEHDKSLTIGCTTATKIKIKIKPKKNIIFLNLKTIPASIFLNKNALFIIIPET